MTKLPLPALHDAEGNTAPVDFPPVVDAHVHVQCFDMNGEEMEDLYDLCQREGKPMVIHAGREPKSQMYPCDPYEICRAEKLELVLQSFPMVRVCVPHLGVDEFAAYKNLIEQYDNLL